MIVKLLAEHHLGFLSLKGGCRGSSESTHIKMPHCWKSHAQAQMDIHMKKCSSMLIGKIKRTKESCPLCIEARVGNITCNAYPNRNLICRLNIFQIF